MPDPAKHVRERLIERVRQIIDEHRAPPVGDDAQKICSCEAHGLPDHSGHLAEQIIDGLDLKADVTGEVERRIRYATAWFDWELTQLEGAQQ